MGWKYHKSDFEIVSFRLEEKCESSKNLLEIVSSAHGRDLISFHCRNLNNCLEKISLFTLSLLGLIFYQFSLISREVNKI